MRTRRKPTRSIEELIASSGYDPDDPFLSTEQAAAVLNVSQETVRRWLRKGAIPYKRMGQRLFRIKRSAVERFAEGSTPNIDTHNTHNTL